MALTPSTMLPLGTRAPDFQLPNVVTGELVSLKTFSQSKALLVMFICQHCPFVQHMKSELVKLGKDYKNKGLGVVAICSNDIEHYPKDAPEALKSMALELKLAYPLCFDETQTVAKAYEASCTPDFYLFDQDRDLVYRGQLDDSRPGNSKPVTGVDLRTAIRAVLTGKPVSELQRPSIGCNIKWKPGNEPAYGVI
jgi:peroxiredoxin